MLSVDDKSYFVFLLQNAIADPIILETLDTTNGVLFPFYDPDVNLLYLCAKVRLEPH